MGAGIRTTLSFFMHTRAFCEIVGNAGIKAVVVASENINRPHGEIVRERTSIR